MSQATQRIVQETIGGACIGAFIYLAYLTLETDAELPLPMMTAIVLLILVLMGKLEEIVDLIEALTELIRAWRE